MTTLNQSIKKKKKLRKKKKTILNNNPQIKGLLLRTIIMSPKKPNSANRKVGIVKLKNKKKIKAYIPGERTVMGENVKVLIRGGNTKDLPGVNHKIILNNLNCYKFHYRVNKRSKYSVKYIEMLYKKYC